MKKQVGIVSIVVCLILIIDQVIKIWVKSSFEPNEEVKIFGEWFKMLYIENPGMAFGATFGGSIWAKLGLSVFRIIAIVAITIYIFRQIKSKVKTEYLIALSLVLAGATGNLIDSMFYDFIFPFDPCEGFNVMNGSGKFVTCDEFGIAQKIETRHSGFLLANVVDMFEFTAKWPSWVPWFDKNATGLNDNIIFPAIWNVADASISCGVVMLIIRQRKYFPKNKSLETSNIVSHEMNTQNITEENKVEKDTTSENQN